MGPALPKCNMGRDSCPNFCYKDGAGSGPRFGPPPVRCPVGIRKQLTDAGHRIEHAGERARWVAVSLNAGLDVLDVKGLDMTKPKKTPAKAREFAFEKGDFVVYPTHGVGRVIDIEAKEIAGHKLDLFVISFEQERMMLRVPVAKAKISGLRKLSSRKIMESALVTLKGRSRACATCIAMPASPTSPTANARSTRRRWTGWRASWPRSSASTRTWPRRS